MEIVALSHSVTQSHSYAVVLGEVGGVRRMPIVIGGFEAQAIAVALEKMNPARPLTHDLMFNVCNAFDVKLDEIVIDNLVEGIFYAKLICTKNGKRLEIDSRTSDAIAMAVRFVCPIYTFEFILDQAGIVLDESQKGAVAVKEEKPKSKKKTEEKSDLTKHTLTELNDLLSEFIGKEDYEKAAVIRDEINRREKGS